MATAASHSALASARKVRRGYRAAVTSTLVTGSAATTSQRTGAGDFAAASKTRSLNNSALAKNKGAS